MDYKDLQKDKEEDIHFWYRARLLFIEYLLENTFSSVGSEGRILDIGCGTGTEIAIMRKFGNVTALDSNREALAFIENSDVTIKLGDIETIELSSSYYNAVFCFDVLEHLEKDELVIEKIYKCLQTGGLFIFTVPACKFLFGPHDKALEHKRRYDKKELELKILKSGFLLKKSGYWNSVLFPILAIFRLLKKLFSRIVKNKTPKTETALTNKFINKIFFQIMRLDLWLIKKGLNLPFGLTVYGIAEKK